MTEILKINGPPGTGKTTKITEMFERAVQSYGPHRVAAVTYTRAAAHVLQDRAAKALGITYRTRKELQRELPYVGTLHALAYRLIGNPSMVDSKNVQEFFDDRTKGTVLHGAAPSIPSIEEAEGFLYDMADDLREYFLMSIAGARHRGEPVVAYLQELRDARFERAWSLLDHQHAYTSYEDWKKDRTLYDFEDLLEYAPTELPGVRVLIVDEAQDCSALMMAVLKNWSAGTVMTVYAGDPYQALYTWAGADPHLLMDVAATQPLKTLTVSHRLPQQSGAAAYADLLLNRGGWPDSPWRGTWTAGGAGEETDGSAFILARTRKLLDPVRHLLQQQGTPYRELRGRSPLDTLAAEAFKVLADLQQGRVLPAGELAIIARGMPAAKFCRGVHRELAALKGEGLMSGATVEKILQEPLPDVMGRLPHARYLRRVLEQHGLPALHHPPKLALGTVHAAKGLEADHVQCVSSWGTLPARNIGTLQGAQQESCVAYVAATRHRVDFCLTSVGAPSGRLYPWP